MSSYRSVTMTDVVLRQRLQKIDDIIGVVEVGGRFGWFLTNGGRVHGASGVERLLRVGADGDKHVFVGTVVTDSHNKVRRGV